MNINKKLRAFFTAIGVVFALSACSRRPVGDIPSNPVVPTPLQVEYHNMEFIGFVHFGMNTFTDTEWGFGNESPQIFDPTEFDANQWAKTAKEAGMKELILTAKHHDGFCLWPSRYTEHSVKNSPWKSGKGDIVREFVEACRRNGLKAGLYLSPWDRNHAGYGTPAYIEYYRNQLRELLTEYGEIAEVWFDGANGGTGFYGGANESRRIDRRTYYGWKETWALVKKLQPNALIFSDAGPDIRWTGNERGYAGETNWSMIDASSITVGEADNAYLNSGDPEGSDWLISLCNTSIRPGWFYHQTQDEDVKSPQELMDVFYRSVGRNGVLLLNIPPDKKGLFHENDIRALEEFKKIRDETFVSNLVSGKKVKASSTWLDLPKYKSSHIADDDPDSYWAADEGSREATLEIDLGEPVQFDRVLIQEPIRFGQRISNFEIQVWKDNEWASLVQGTTVGHKRILRFPSVESDRVRVVIKGANNSPAISNFGLYRSSDKENDPSQRIKAGIPKSIF